jgi:hypothetical protein
MRGNLLRKSVRILGKCFFQFLNRDLGEHDRISPIEIEYSKLEASNHPCLYPPSQQKRSASIHFVYLRPQN